MSYNVPIKVLDASLRLHPQAAADLAPAVSAALLALEASRPGTLDDVTPAATIAFAIEAVGWSACWAGGELAGVITSDWLRIPLARLLTWAAAVERS